MNPKQLLLGIVVGVIVVGGAVYLYSVSKRPPFVPFLTPQPSQSPQVSMSLGTSPLVQASPSPAKIPTLPTASFSFPYPVSWDEGNAKFSLTGASLGKIQVPLDPQIPDNPTNRSFEGGRYRVGEEVYALKLFLKISIASSPAGQIEQCVPLNIMRLLNEEGDLTAPAITQLLFPGVGGCGNRPGTYVDYPIYFLVPELEKEFFITTGGASNIFFRVFVSDDGKLQVEKVS